MKEITLLIFILACCCLGYRFIQNILNPHRYRIVFFIPGTSDNNITFGSMFFCFAIALMCNNIYASYALTIIGLLLFFYGYWQHCCKNFFCGNRCILISLCKFIIQKQVQKQIQLNQEHNHIYKKAEALRILGLPSTINHSNQTIEKHYRQIVSTLKKRNFTPEELLKTLELAKQTITKN